jgi:hypothetical protein
LEGAAVFCQNPLKDRADAIDARYSSLQPVVAYKIIIDSNDLTSYSVEMHIRNVPGTFRVAMVTE